jgi:hypothetical protein
MSVLKRKYNEEIPDSAKYKVPQASIPSRRTQIKINPDGKTSFGPNEIIRIMIPPQGYFDPEFSYLSFDIRLKAPSTYYLKALEVWNSHSTAYVYDTGFGNLLAVGKGGVWGQANAGTVGQSITERSKAVPVPVMRHVQQSEGTAVAGGGVTLKSNSVRFEWVPVGHVHPVLPFSAHGFFNRVVLRTANNTPVEDIQDYDYLSAHLGQLLQSEGYTSTMGGMLEGWGDVRERAKLGLACISNLKYFQPLLRTDAYDKNGFTNNSIYSGNYGTVNSSGSEAVGSTASVNGLSPEGVLNASLKETIGGVKMTCNLNLGLLQQKQNLPLLFTGGFILELYTAPFERCMSFKTVYSRIDATDMPNLADGGTVNGVAELVDITAMDCALPYTLTSILGIPHEVTNDLAGLRHVGRPIAGEEYCHYYKSGFTLADLPDDTDETARRELSCSYQAFLDYEKVSPGSSALTTVGRQTLSRYDVDADEKVILNPTSTKSATQYESNSYEHVKACSTALESRYRNSKWVTVGGSDGWTYELANVELRADMLQFSQSYDESVAAIVDSDEGLPITFQTFSVQKMTYDGQRSTLTMNERARSIQFALAVFKDPESERTTHTFYADNDSKFYCFGDHNIPVATTRFQDGFNYLAATGYTARALGYHGDMGSLPVTNTTWETTALNPTTRENIGGRSRDIAETVANNVKTFTYPAILDTNQGVNGYYAYSIPHHWAGFAVEGHIPQFESVSHIGEAKPFVTTNPATPLYRPVTFQLRYLGGVPLEDKRWNAANVIGPLISHTFYKSKFVAISNPWRSFMRLLPADTQGVSLFPDLKDYQFRIGTRFIPSSPVDCSSGAVQSYIELMKAIGLYGSFSGDGRRALMPGIRITPDQYAKRICTRDQSLLSAGYGNVISGQSSKIFPGGITGTLDCKDYVGCRYRIPERFILGQNFSDIPDHAAGIDTATQALAVELALNGEMSPAKTMNVYVFLNVRRDMFVRCGGQMEILY